MLKGIIAVGVLCASFASIAQTEKIVTAGGTITELVFALGAGDQVVAVDQSSLYPKKVSELPSVGYYRDLAAEGVLSTGLTQLLAQEGSGRDNAIKQIAAAGVEINYYKKAVTVDAMLSLIQQLGKDLNKEARAAQLISEIKATLPTSNKQADAKALFLLSAGERGIIAAGKETVPQFYFDHLGVTNVAVHEGFKGIGLESLAVSQPDFLMAPAHVVYSMGGKQAFCAQPQLALLKAAKICNLLVMDSLLALGMTPRVAKALAEIESFLARNP